MWEGSAPKRESPFFRLLMKMVFSATKKKWSSKELSSRFCCACASLRSRSLPRWRPPNRLSIWSVRTIFVRSYCSLRSRVHLGDCWSYVAVRVWNVLLYRQKEEHSYCRELVVEFFNHSSTGWLLTNPFWSHSSLLLVSAVTTACWCAKAWISSVCSAPVVAIATAFSLTSRQRAYSQHDV